jgi:ParB family transcriptional regulator, chromosome partitioning protein
MELKTKNRMVGLGRGLGALLTDSDSPKEESINPAKKPESPGSMNEISVDSIATNPFQPRTYFDQEALQELAESIRIQGIIQPITVRKIEDGKYQLISGERRLQASKIVGLTSVPAYVRTANDQQMLEMALIENIQRENLNAIEVALSYQRLITECSLRQEQLGERVGKNRTTVNNYIRLLKLPPIIQASLRDNQISMGHARAIINIDNPESQLIIFNTIVNDDLSVRKVEELVRSLQAGEIDDLQKPKARAANTMKEEFQSLQYKLASYFGAKVSIKVDDKHKGEIRIPFTTQEELDKILGNIKM